MSVKLKSTSLEEQNEQLKEELALAQEKIDEYCTYLVDYTVYHVGDRSLHIGDLEDHKVFSIQTYHMILSTIKDTMLIAILNDVKPHSKSLLISRFSKLLTKFEKDKLDPMHSWDEMHQWDDWINNDDEEYTYSLLIERLNVVK